MTRIAVVIPVFNDWESFTQLIAEIDHCASRLRAVLDLIAIDDGSSESMDASCAADLNNIGSVAIVTLACNLGHQRAIAVGLAHVHNIGVYDGVIVMDSDGEDRPKDVERLLAESHREPQAIVVAQRKQRSEGSVFLAFYLIYKLIFRVMTGQSIDFGNFCFIPNSHLVRLLYMKDLWNHLAASVVRARTPIARLQTRRGQRYAGKSKMNFSSLILHGLSAMAVFSDFLFVRLTMASVAIFAVATAAALTAAAVRVLTDLAIPGWATTVVGLAGIVLLQALTLLVVATLMTLTSRASLSFVPAIHAPVYVKQVREIKRNDR